MFFRYLSNFTVILLGLLFLAVACAADEQKAKSDKRKAIAEIDWVKYDDGLKMASETNKLILVDFYTNWCKFCKKMDRETFSDKGIMDYLSRNFVTVKVNAESNEKMALPDGSMSGRQLARSFSVRGYPTYWFLKPDGEKINLISGYSPAERFIHVLRFIGDGHYENKTFKEYLSEVVSSR